MATYSDSTHKPADTENSRKIWLSHQMPLPQSLLQVMGEVTEWGTDGWSVQVEPRRIQSQSVHGFDIVFASNAGEREIRMQPVHLLDGRGGTPGTFPVKIVDDLGLHVADVSQMLGVRAAVETYSRRHDL